jgi:hypothetical protein
LTMEYVGEPVVAFVFGVKCLISGEFNNGDDNYITPTTIQEMAISANLARFVTTTVEAADCF